MTEGRWNHNLHYHPIVLEAIPSVCERALDVGCGEGSLTRELLARVPRIVGIDLDRTSIELARADPNRRGVTYLRSDLLRHPFVEELFDLVTAVALLHHVDAAAGLERLRDLLSPGGVLVVIGLARSRSPVDLAIDLAGAVVRRVSLHRRGSYWQHPSPVVWPPPQTYGEMRRIADRLLPRARYRRHLLWRYSLVWIKPELSSAAAGAIS